MLDEQGNPFWMKFFKADYLAETEPAKTVGKGGKDVTKFANKVADTLEKQEKLRKEFEKIRRLDAELAHRT